MAHCFSLAIADESIFILGGEKDILNNVQVDKESRRGCLSQNYFKKLSFCFSIITRSTWRYTDSIPPHVQSDYFSRPGNKTGVNATFDSNKNWNNNRYDSFVRATSRHFTSSVCSMVTGIIVKSAHDLSVLCGLAFLFIYRNLCVTVAVSSLGSNLSTSLLVSGVSGHHLVISATRSFWSSAILDFQKNHFVGFNMTWDEASLVARLCYLCRQQQPPCGETATPSRTQSIYHKPASRRFVASGHCCQA